MALYGTVLPFEDPEDLPLISVLRRGEKTQLGPTFFDGAGGSDGSGRRQLQAPKKRWYLGVSMCISQKNRLTL